MALSPLTPICNDTDIACLYGDTYCCKVTRHKLIITMGIDPFMFVSEISEACALTSRNYTIKQTIN